MGTCSIDGCDHQAKTRGLCNRCYLREKTAGRLEQYPRLNTSCRDYGKLKKCSVEGCARSMYARDYCRLHYSRVMRRGSTDRPTPTFDSDICAVEGCERARAELGFCTMHAYRQRTYGDPGPAGLLRRGGARTTEQEVRARAALALKQAGFTYDEIGVCFGVTHQRIQQLLRPTEWEAMLARSDGKCEECGETGRLHASHPPDYSGPADRVLCTRCHRKRDTEADRSRWLTPAIG